MTAAAIAPLGRRVVDPAPVVPPAEEAAAVVVRLARQLAGAGARPVARLGRLAGVLVPREVRRPAGEEVLPVVRPGRAVAPLVARSGRLALRGGLRALVGSLGLAAVPLNSIPGFPA